MARLLSCFVVLLLVLGLSPAAAQTESGASGTASSAVEVPDHPSPLSLDPTSIKNLEAGDPGAGISLVEPPSGSATGEAQLAFPFVLPPGRAGVTPRLGLTYSSGGSNGWVGSGWDVKVPSVSVDTRWGVPRYDAANETETYLLDGTQLAPVAHRGEWRPRQAEAVFHLRTEGAFSRIVRHGDSPAAYWWEVTDKQGVSYFYGGDPATGAVAQDAVLTASSLDANGQARACDGLAEAPAGNVFRWMLREVRDLHGNGIRYDYDFVCDYGVATGGRVAGFQLYLSEINYTQRGGQPGPYTVRLHREGARRTDVQVDGRGGFKEVTAHRLGRVEVLFGSELVRGYDLAYEEGAFGVSLLQSVTPRGADGGSLPPHVFDYHGATVGFASPATVATGSQADSDDELGWTADAARAPEPLRGVLRNFLADGQASALSGSVSDAVGGHVYVGFAPAAPSKTNSAGGKVGFNSSTSRPLLTLIDLNGDSLADKVFTPGDGRVLYRLNESAPGSPPVFGPVQDVPSLPSLGEETTLSGSLGLEAHFGASAFVNHAEGFVTNRVYFSDVNGDGLVDLVNGAQVLFNRLVAGRPTFAADSAGTPAPLGGAPVPVDTGGLVDYAGLRAQQEEAFPLLDTVRRWTAPFTGTIRISGTARLVEDTSAERQRYDDADGVRLAIQHNGTELWSARVAGGEHTDHTPTGVDAVTVQAGDRLYFRVGSVADGAFDRVAWDPQIVYLGSFAFPGVPPVFFPLSSADANGLDAFRYRASGDFTLAGRPGITVQLPASGTVRLEGDLQKSAATTDDVTVVITKTNPDDDPPTTETLLSSTLAAASVGSAPLGLDLPVRAGEELLLQVRVDSPISLAALQWSPRLHYTTIETPPGSPPQPATGPDGRPLLVVSLPYDIEFYPVTNLRWAQERWVAPEDGELHVSTDLSASGADTGSRGNITFTVKRRSSAGAPARLAKRTLSVVSFGGFLFPTNTSVDMRVQAGEVLFFDFTARNPRVAHAVDRDGAAVDIEFVPDDTNSTTRSAEVAAGFHTKPDPPKAREETAAIDAFPHAYRGWGVAGYNANAGRAIKPVDETRLVLPPPPADGTCDASPDDRDLSDDEVRTSPCNQTQASAAPFAPLPEPNTAGTWRGPDEGTWAGPSEASSSRIGGDQLQEVAPAGAAPVTVARLSRTSQTSVGGSVHAVSGSVSGVGPLPGSSWSDLDYLDLNGDQFPDVVGPDRAQYTRPTGVLDQHNVALPGLGEPLLTDSDAANVGIGGSANPATFRADSRGGVESSGRTAPRGNGSGTQMVQLGVSVGASLGSGSSRTQHELRDVNGDALPDRLTVEAGVLQVALNLGYGFAPAEPWGQAHLSDGASANADVRPGLSVNTGSYDFAGGLSVAGSISQTACGRLGFRDLPNSLDVACSAPKTMLADLTGDGLVDRVRAEQTQGGGEVLRVAANIGAGFGAEEVWDGALSDGLATNTTTTLGGGLYFTVAIGPLCLVGCYLIINPGADYARTMARQTSALRDINGDGYADHLASGTAGTMTVALNRLGPTNLLRTVSRPLGARIDLGYDRDRNTPDQPHVRWLLSEVTVYDGHAGDGVDRERHTYRYAGGRFDRRERQFTGYRAVVEEQRNAADDTIYRTVTREFRNDSVHTVGLLEREALRDADGRVFTETEYTYRFRDVTTGAETTAPDDTGSAVVFPQLVRIDERHYEGESTAGKATFTTYAYDAFGNVTETFAAGDEGTADDLRTHVAYASCSPTHVVGVAVTTIRVGEGVDERTDADLDCATGEVREVRERLDAATSAVHQMRYTADGNLEEYVGPPNLHGQRYTLRYAYDEPTATHVVVTTDSHGYRSTTEHDLRFGVVRHATDTNGNTTSSAYDEFGRPSALTAPYEQGSGLATVRYDYHPASPVPWALTRHLDRFRDAADPIETAVFVDGLGRVVQTKKDAAVHVAPGQAVRDVMTVSGRVDYDLAGRAVRRFHPTVEPLGQAGVFNAAVDGIDPTLTDYDVLDRVTRTRMPDGSETRTSYGFGADDAGITRLETTDVDANGNVKQTYRDVDERIIATAQHHTPAGGGTQLLWTSHTYDARGRLLAVRDNKGATVSIGYDALGRRATHTSAGGGTTAWRYDLAGNLIGKTSANVRATGAEVSYDYDFTRLTAIRYPQFADNNVTYTYGAPSADHNRAGRITAVTDGSGRQERFYGKLGETTRETRTIASHTEGASANSPEVYTTDYVYDTFGRLRQLTYPDGEVLTYTYDSGGQLASAAGVKAGHTYPYWNALEYDKFGERAYMEAGNGVRTTYAYNPRNRRLDELATRRPDQAAFQQLAYTYDNVGNILTLDHATPESHQFGGPVQQRFTYDDLYRLIAAEGTYHTPPDKQNSYRLALTYDTNHNILTKQQTHTISQPSSTPVPQHDTTYDHTYHYDGAYPHAPTHAGDRTYSYDRNGNQTGWAHDGNATRHTRVWDEEDRLRSVDANGHTIRFVYDAADQRVLKRGPEGEIAYVNPFFTIRNREVATKHVYAGTTRVAAKAVKQPKPGTTTTAPAPYERSTFFFHPDHIGSTNYITDPDGAIYERGEYLPFGDPWAHEIGGRQVTEYTYGGKEHDAETALYHYGARYYDTRLSTFASSDPLLTELSGDVAAHPEMLNAFSYAVNNPVRYTDPDGRCPVCRSKVPDGLKLLPPSLGGSLGPVRATATHSQAAVGLVNRSGSQAAWLSYDYGEALQLVGRYGQYAAGLGFDPGTQTGSVGASIGQLSFGVALGPDAWNLTGALRDASAPSLRSEGWSVFVGFGSEPTLPPLTLAGFGGQPSFADFITRGGEAVPPLLGQVPAVFDDPVAGISNLSGVSDVSGAANIARRIGGAGGFGAGLRIGGAPDDPVRIQATVHATW